MVEQDAGTTEHPIGLPEINGRPVGGKLRDPVGTPGVERRTLVLRRRRSPEHLTGGRLVELDLRIDEPDSLQQVYDANAIDFVSVDLLIERRGDERLGRQVVDLLRIRIL